MNETKLYAHFKLKSETTFAKLQQFFYTKVFLFLSENAFLEKFI